MNVVEIKFVTNVQNKQKSITVIKPIREILGMLEDIDSHNLVIEVASAKGSKAVVTQTTSGGETKVSDFSDHIECGELVTVTIRKL
ncbi:Uncharacterised protein [Kingella potus]|uniref:Uncharacterized protein n=1 Tax=Kingella potus TaxID=265175 RepID=A0A377R060_9NEIS|nr:hypothetical protein [Kingella potus]UOP01289.1 hypothetical protein LVJ84_03245 [Kingella potus]STR01016.1 Uncharacterised protein [Kingella potus]